MVNRMVFFYVYDIAERFTSDFGESLLPVLFSPTEPKNTPMIHDHIQDSQVESENKRKRSRNAPSARSLNPNRSLEKFTFFLIYNGKIFLQT